MNLNRFTSVLLLFLLLPLTAINAMASQSHNQQSEFSDRYRQGLLQANSDLFTGQYASDVKIMPEYDKAFIGLEDARHYYASIFKRYQVSRYTRNQIEVIDIGERRLVIGLFEMTVTSIPTNEETAITGTYFDIWDISQDKHRVLTMAWNFNQSVPGAEKLFRANHPAGVHYAFLPIVAVDNEVAIEVAQGHMASSQFMLRLQPEPLVFNYHPEAWYSPHDRPIVKGRAAIKEFQLDYAKNWPTFDYVDVNAHELYAHGEFVLEHMSYNLRWRTREDYSGLTMGKGIRLAKRDKQGGLKAYRSIAMHD